MLRVFVDAPRYFIRPNNTDWRYMATLDAFSGWGSIQLAPDDTVGGFVAASAPLVLEKAGLGSLARHFTDRRRIRGRFLARRSIDVVYSHTRPPLVEPPYPLVWFFAILDPVMLRSYGVTEDVIEMQKAEFSEMLPRAVLVQVATRIERDRHLAIFPEAASKFVNVPFLLAHVIARPVREIIDKHRGNGKIKVLFVGNEARRKGLDIVASAIRSLPPHTRAKMEFTVVSRQFDPTWFVGIDVVAHRTLPRDRVLEQMRCSHIFVMPSRFESFGFVFIEAMASGCAIIAPHWEAQREILDDGKAGVCSAPEVDKVAEALHSLVEDAERRLQLALTARDRYEMCYSTPVVAGQYVEMFERAAALAVGDRKIVC